jgi:hypothetical protein
MTRLAVVTFFLFVFGQAQAQLTGHILDEIHHIIPGAKVLLIQAKAVC